MTRDSGRLPQGGDAQQAPCEASQSGHEVASPSPHRNPSSTPPPVTEEMIEAGYAIMSLPLGECGCDYKTLLGRAYLAMHAARSNQEATPADAVLDRLRATLADATAMDLPDDTLLSWDADEQPNLCVGDLRALTAKPVQEATRTVGDAEEFWNWLTEHQSRDGTWLQIGKRDFIDALSHTSSCGGK